MREKIVKNFEVILILLLVAVIPTISAKTAKATKVSTQWGYLYPSPPAGEQTAESWICNEIYENFDDSGWGSSNAWGTYTQLGYVFQTLQYCQNPSNNVDWATAWWVGDFIPDNNFPPEHRGFYGYNNQHIFDNNVYAYANYYYWPPPSGWWQSISSKHYFDFIWTCSNGGLYFDSSGDTWNVDGITYPETDYDEYTTPPNPANNPFTHYGYVENPYSTPPTIVGMPYGWTGTTGMSTNGYGSPDYGNYCYIGFENASPWMVDPTGYNSKFYKHFPYYFYRYALGIDGGPTHHTIQESLDYASTLTCGWGYDFDDTSLYTGYWEYKDVAGDDYDGWWYCRMRVLGNSNLNLPY